MRFIGDSVSASFLWESGTYSVVSGARQWIGMVQEGTVDESTNVIPVRYLSTATRNVSQWVDGAKDVAFNFSYFPQDWRMLVFALGSNVDAGSPSPYTHVISEVNSASGGLHTSGTMNPFTSYQLELAHKGGATGENFIRTLIGCNTNSLTINASQGEIISVDVEGIAQDAVTTSGAITLATEDTTRPFMWRDVKVHIPSGTVIPEVKQMSFSVNNNMEAPHYLNGSQVIAPPIPLGRDYEVSLTLDATSENTKTFHESYFLGGSMLNQGTGSEFNMMIEINASAGSRDAFFVLSGCKMLDLELPNPIEGVTETSLTIRPKNCIVNVNDATQIYNAH